ncbi:hypothetical protein ABVV53_05005 [Novosphingobium sp. RD2P27]|uniref:Uncharacterized protein n=1 Tax=Novosphingobium kalidii TaxID=3230299 RepID=A0ABV2CZH9_9SPHN
MHAVTEVDREAAEELRVLLADLSGFWYNPDDTGPLCAALARHRVQSELRMLEKISQAGLLAIPGERGQGESDSLTAPAFDIRTRRRLPNALNR